RDDDADDVDVLGVDDVVPVGVMAGVAEALSGRGGEVCGDIADGDEFYRREVGGSCGGRRAPGGGVGAAGHAGPDDGDPEGLPHVILLLMRESGIGSGLHWSDPEVCGALTTLHANLSGQKRSIGIICHDMNMIERM